MVETHPGQVLADCAVPPADGITHRAVGRRSMVLVLLAAVLALAIPPVRVSVWRSLELLATGQLAQFQHYMRSLGAWAPLLSIALMAVAAVAVPIPVAILMVANGLAFGLIGGMVVSLSGALLGAAIAFIIGRLGRPVVARCLPASSLAQADRLINKYGKWAIVIGRLIPGVPCDPVSYVAGMSDISVGVFLLLTTIGLVPATLATALLGVQEGGDVPTRYWLLGLALIAAAWITWRAWRRPSAKARENGRT